MARDRQGEHLLEKLLEARPHSRLARIAEKNLRDHLHDRAREVAALKAALREFTTWWDEE